MSNTNTTNAKVSRANVGRRVTLLANKGFGFYKGTDLSLSVSAYSLLVTVGISLEALIKDANSFSRNPTKENFDSLRIGAVAFSKAVKEEKLGKFGR